MAWDGAIAGYNRVRQQDDASSLAELQRAGAVQGIVKSAIEQEAAAKSRARKVSFAPNSRSWVKTRRMSKSVPLPCNQA